MIEIVLIASLCLICLSIVWFTIKLTESQCTNCLLISNTFALPNREPEQTIRLSDLYNTPVYIYQL